MMETKIDWTTVEGAIFDVDGTLLDSMAIWEDAGARYLKSRGIKPEPGLGKILFPMSLEDGVDYVKKNYHLEEAEEELKAQVLKQVQMFYEEEVKLKPGAKQLLEKIYAAKIPMIVATSSDKAQIQAAFTRLGVIDYFREIWTCTEAGAGKDKPDIYFQCAQKLGSSPEHTLVFEDALHAAQTAKKAGFLLAGVYDTFSAEGQEELKALSDVYIKAFKNTRKTALTIAGSDSSGGAGIQADMKTMQANGVYAMSAITALTAQNTTGVYGISEVSPEFLGQQLDCIFTDIFPEAVKIGMVASGELVKVIASKLKEYKAANIVVDPVMVSTSGSKLINDEAVSVLKKELFPLASVLTPNIPEAEVLFGASIRSAKDMEIAAEVISKTYRCAVLLKGGHKLNDANDLLYANGESRWFYGERIDNPNTHGTGCTLSSAIASNLAKGYDLTEAVERAKKYISGALAAMLDLGKGSGPMDHGFAITGEFAK